MSTTQTPTITVRLSCRHVVDFPAKSPAFVTGVVGAQVGCEKCPTNAAGDLRTRRVKAVLTPEPTEAPAETEPRPSEAAMAAVVAAEQAEAAETAVARFARIKATGEADPKRGPRVVAASRESKDLKAWRDGGETGDRPATPNLDYIEAEEAARAERRGDANRPAGPVDRTVDPANPMALGLAQGPTGMVDSSAMTPDDPKPARRTRERKADTPSGGRVTDLNLSAPRRAVMLEALPEAPDGTVEDVASVVALRTKVAAGADRVDVDAAGVRALLTGLAPMCTAGNKAACRLNDWLTKFADEVGYKPVDA